MTRATTVPVLSSLDTSAGASLPTSPGTSNGPPFGAVSPGATGIVGRRIWQTWDQMSDLLKNYDLNLKPVITHEMHYTEFQRAMELMKAKNTSPARF